MNLQAALAHHQAGRLDEAEAIYRQILAVQPRHSDALHLLGLIATATGRGEEALDLISRAIALSPSNAVYHSNLGETLRRLGRLDEAIACFNRALALRADIPDTHLNLGEALTDSGRCDEAIASARRALALRPGWAEAHNNMGRAFSAKDQHAEAETCYRHAIELNPGYTEAWNNLANTCCEQDRWDEAIASAQHALALRPGYAEARSNLGVACRNKGDLDAAMRCFREAIACEPGFPAAHWNLALQLLLTGRFEEGWREHEWRSLTTFGGSPRRPFTVPQWDGGPAPGAALLIHAEQGFGDAIQFLRYVPLVRERSRAARVILECAPQLTRLFAQSCGDGVEIVARQSWGSGHLPAFDLHLPMLSLPLVLGRFEPLPMSQPYVRADDALRAAWRERLGPPRFHVGVAWAGSPRHKDDRRRSIGLARFAPILRVPGVNFISLQIEPPAPANAGIADFTARIADFTDTAALIAELDLVITVDSAVAHLAGALGKPVWTLVARVPDWRWGIGGENTPWYPAMRLFRQPAPGDWEPVVRRVADELERTRR